MTASALFAAIYLGAAAAPVQKQTEVAAQRLHADVGLGLGLMLDSRTPGSSDNNAVLCFLASLGVGGRSLGGALNWTGANRSGAEDAPGRSYYSLVLVARPAAFREGAPTGYEDRVLRSLAFEAGPAYEVLQKATGSASRWGVSTSAHVDFPLQPAGHSEGRMRLEARRMWGISAATFGGSPVADSAVQMGALLVALF